MMVIGITSMLIRAGMYLCGHAVDPLTSCIFILIMVAILEDYMLLSYIFFKKKLRFNLAIKSLLLPSFLTSLTTVIGFGSLSVSDNPSIVNFSLWTSFGAAFEWVALFLILPAILNFFPKIKEKLESRPIPEPKIHKTLLKITPGKWMTVFMALIPLGLFIFKSEGNLNHNPIDYLPKDHEIGKTRDYLLKTRGTEGEVSIVFADKRTDVGPYLSKLAHDPYIVQIFSSENLKDYFGTAPMEIQSLLVEDFNRSPLGPYFNSRDSKRFVASVKSFSSKEIPEFQKRVKEICGSACEAISEVITANDYDQGTLKTLYDSFNSGFSFILVLILWLIFALNRFYLFPVLIATIWASFTLLFIVLQLQVKLNIATCVALSILVGAAGDNAIQFLLLKRETLYESIKELGEATLEMLILMVGVCLCLSFSYFQSARDLCSLLITGIILMYLGDIIVLSGLVKLWDGFKKRD